MDIIFYKNTLLPSLFRAKRAGVNLRNKSALLHYFSSASHESEHLWVCCAAGTDLEQTADIVDRMSSAKANVIAELNLLSDFPEKTLRQVVTGMTNNDVAKELAEFITAGSPVDRLNSLLWKSNLKVIAPEKASEKDVYDLSERAFDYLKEQTNSEDDIIKDAVFDFIDQVYLSDVDFKGSVQPQKIAAAKHLYYKNKDDALDQGAEIDSEVSEEQIQLGMREFRKYLV